MRYVGRHRAQRPLLLRRPVVGGVVAAALLAGPVLYVTGNFGTGVQRGTPSQQVADGTDTDPTPAGAATGTAGGPTLVPTDGSTVPAAGSTRTTVRGPFGQTAGTGVVIGGGSGSGSGQTTRPTTSTSTSKPGSKPTKTTTKPPKTTTKSPKPPATTSPTPDPPTPDPPTPDPPTPDPTIPPVLPIPGN